MSKPHPCIGHKFGRLTVLEVFNSKRWKVVCDCGKEKIVSPHNIKSGRSSSCGCLVAELNKSRSTHGKTESAEYIAWCGMKARCSNPKEMYFHRYGGRGIKVCPEWKGPGGFEKFLAHVGPKPHPSLSIDRINNDKHYELGNVRWATRKVQSRNVIEDAKKYKAHGKNMTLREWSKELRVIASTLASRLHRNIPPEIAFTSGGILRRGRLYTISAVPSYES